MSLFRVSVIALVLAAAPLTANAFSFGFSDDDFNFGDNSYYGPRGGYGGYGPYAPYPPYPPRGYGRDSGPGAWGGGPMMQFGSDEGGAPPPSQDEAATQPRDRQSGSSWKWGGRPWGEDSWGRSWDDDDGARANRKKTWRWGNSKMDWGNRWRPNFGSGWTPGYQPRWNMYPGWEQYQYGPQGQQQRQRSRDMMPGQTPKPPVAQPQPSQAPAAEVPATQ